MHGLLATRTFTSDDQHWFADASGDHNPMHVDPVAARRTMFGQTVVHGMHVALWALDQWCRTGDVAPARVVVMFAKPVFLDEEVTLVAGAGAGGSAQLRVRLGDVTVASIRVESGAVTAVSDAADDPRDHAGSGGVVAPTELDTHELADRHGIVSTPSTGGQWSRAFPMLGTAIGGVAIGELAATSAIVGMHCPGLHSVFGSLDVRLDPSAGGPACVAYRVSRVETALSAVRMEVTGSQITGTVSAFVRPAPVRQPSMNEIAAAVDHGEFAGARAIIVGGSRGLGEVAGKLVAAGGGHVVLTWHHGEHDALTVAREIREAGGSVEMFHLDTGDPVVPAGLADGVTHLYYFASPRITARRLAAFDTQAFAALRRRVRHRVPPGCRRCRRREWVGAARAVPVDGVRRRHPPRRGRVRGGQGGR
jgi:acyl dehydratase